MIDPNETLQPNEIAVLAKQYIEEFAPDLFDEIEIDPHSIVESDDVLAHLSIDFASVTHTPLGSASTSYFDRSFQLSFSILARAADFESGRRIMTEMQGQILDILLSKTDFIDRFETLPSIEREISKFGDSEHFNVIGELSLSLQDKEIIHGFSQGLSAVDIRTQLAGLTASIIHEKEEDSADG